MTAPHRTWLDDAYDRGSFVRLHPSGMKVVMLVDEPGVFRNTRGDTVSVDLARDAGFDVERLTKERLKRERIAQATALVEREFSGEREKEIVGEKAGYKMIHVGFGRYVIEDEDGNRITPKPLSKEQAQGVLKGMAPGAELKLAEEPKENEGVAVMA